MPRKSNRKRGASKRKSQSQGQYGGAAESAQGSVHTIPQETLNRAAEIAQKVMGSMMKGNSGQVGGSAAASAPTSVPVVGGSAPASAPVVGGSAIPAELQAAMAGGAVAGAVTEAETFSSLKGSPIMGGGRRGRRGRGRGRSSQSNSQSNSQSQSGGMVPGLLTAVETALVPLGLYLGQKALQSRRSSGSRSFGKSFNFRSASRRTRRRR